MRLFHPGYNFLHPRYWFGQIDSRPLSLFRIGFALVLLKDALYHLPLARWLYSDDGIFPRDTLLQIARDNRFSLMDATGKTWQVQLFFLLWIAVLIGLLLGYRTRIMAVLNFILILSIHERNIYVLSGADAVLRTVSFWMMFTSLADYYSLDALRRRVGRYQRSGKLTDLRVETTPHLTFALPVRLLQIQVALVYLFTFLLKLPGEAWHNGNAIHYALQVHSLTLPTGDWMVAHAPLDLLRVITVMSLIIEASFFVLVFIPFWQPGLRLLGLFLGAMLHLGIALLMAILYFSTAMWACYIAFFEPGWVRWLDHVTRTKRQQVQISLPLPGSPRWWLLAITRPDEIAVIEGVRGSWVLDRSGTPLENPDRYLLAHLPLSRLPWIHLKPLALFLPAFLPLSPLPRQGEGGGVRFLYITHPNRALKYLSRLALSLLLIPMMGIVIWWNLTSLEDERIPEPPERAVDMLHYAGLWQAWNMFAPFPITVDGWIVIPGRFENGTTFDLRTGEAVAATMPRTFTDTDQRWKKYESRLYTDAPNDLLWAWGAYYCRRYNIDHDLPQGARLASLEIVYMRRYSVTPGDPPLPYEEYVMWNHWCFDEYAE